MKTHLLTRAVEGEIDRVTQSGKVIENTGYLMKSGYIQVWHKGQNRYAHRLIWESVNGEIPRGMMIDHINGCRSDNRISNLRLVNASQNTQNRHRAEKGNISGEKGVYWRSQISRWAAEIRVDGVKHYLGSFDSVKEAKEAYNSAAAKHHTHNPHATF